ncbi:MAG: galactose mutarotase [Erysipelotrichaceae bacterium]|nr:galactose mutarotase [Erysipelotrichaceae bacterium]
MTIRKESFGFLPNGREASVYVISSDKLTVKVSDFGAVTTGAILKDKNGVERDVILGYPDLESYMANPCCLGAIVGPSANRTANASFSIGNNTYYLEQNDNGNNLHTSKIYGIHKKLWDCEEITEKSVTFRLELFDGELGLPGNRTITVKYTVDDDKLDIEYRMFSDARTVFNVTNHAYFNLAGHNSGKIFDQYLQLKCDYYTPVREFLITTGEVRSVKGTPMDFTTMKKIGRDFDLNDEQLAICRGYDHNFVINDWDGRLRKFARAYCEETGIELSAYTSRPGVQLYTGNYLNAEGGKDNTDYQENEGFCLETQFFPNSLNYGHFASSLISPDVWHTSKTVYRFRVK